MQLKNKIAIVTGAAQGIGRGIALDLAKEGAKVIVSDLKLSDCQKVVREIKALGFEALVCICDVSKQTEVQALVSMALKKYKRLDIFAHNAGIYPFQSFLEMEEADWDKVLNVNLKSAFFCSQAAAKVMKANSKIIHISSIASLVGFAGLSHYCASKAGMNGFVRALALELASKKITVNAVAPGAIDTPGATGSLSNKQKQANSMNIPLARMGAPKDIAQAVSFLASDKANYITGQTIVVDGGYTLN